MSTERSLPVWPFRLLTAAAMLGMLAGALSLFFWALQPTAPESRGDGFKAGIAFTAMTAFLIYSAALASKHFDRWATSDD